MIKRHRIGMSIVAIAIAAGVGMAALPSPTSAALGSTLQKGLTNAAPDDLKTGETNLPLLIGNLIGGLMSLIGAILFVYLLYGGFRWMTAGGDEKKVKEATDVIKNAIIGLLIIVLAYAIATFVITEVGKAASSAPTGPPTG
ncbi:pilin [Patescibacteria group bacterium]|nr:pilin [Patescibacteria group bacterium]MBU1448538.1 pilin [Patescibacteria group bacterium]MBU2613626.1 pilin [Patescibacteria group bacterium]